MIEIMRAMTDETRFKLIKLLLEKRYCVKALAKRLEISEPAVSQHLKVLKNNNLVYGIKKGYFMHYRVNKEQIEEVINFLTEEFSDRRQFIVGGFSPKYMREGEFSSL